VKIGSQLGFAETDVTDPKGRLLAKAHSTISVTADKSR
jgi:acyl-coenzyme A thioesterase PaaI-like protein